MKIASLVHRDVATCTIHDDLARAAQLMWDRDLGCLPVIDDQGHVAGMITDRDICMAAYTRGEPLRAIPISAAMSSRVISCTADDAVADVERTMAAHQIRRMPVINGQNHPVGFISLNDLARAAAPNGSVAPEELVAAMAAICAPRAAIKTARA